MTRKVLENDLGPGKSWNLLGSEWQFLSTNRHVSVDENSHNCCYQVRFLCCRYAKNARIVSRTSPWTPEGDLTTLPQVGPLGAVCHHI